jgi:hypothetical protein
VAHGVGFNGAPQQVGCYVANEPTWAIEACIFSQSLPPPPHQAQQSTNNQRQVFGIAFNPYHTHSEEGSDSGYTTTSASDNDTGSGSSGDSSSSSSSSHRRGSGTTRQRESEALQFATWGVGHVKLWTRDWDEVGAGRGGAADGGNVKCMLAGDYW